jgi:cytoskeleton protein RodZ
MGADRPNDIGSRLREARERKGASLRQIANHTKISLSVLEALERNDISKLPGGIFSRAFVRSYANEVGLDPESTIQDFIAQFPQESVTAGHPKSDRVEDNELFESERRVASSVLRLFLISVPLAAAVVYMGMMNRAAVDSKPDGPSLVSTVGDTVPAAPSREAPAVPAGSSGAVASRPSSDSVAAVVRPTDAPAIPALDDRLIILLSARSPVWVSATVDGQKAIGRLLQPGDRESLEVKREMVITAGDAAAIRMMLNGSEARPLGRTGEVVTARLSPANFKEYLLAR